MYLFDITKSGFSCVVLVQALTVMMRHAFMLDVLLKLLLLIVSLFVQLFRLLTE